MAVVRNHQGSNWKVEFWQERLETRSFQSPVLLKPPKTALSIEMQWFPWIVIRVPPKGQNTRGSWGPEGDYTLELGQTRTYFALGNHRPPRDVACMRKVCVCWGGCLGRVLVGSRARAARVRFARRKEQWGRAGGREEGRAGTRRDEIKSSCKRLAAA